MDECILKKENGKCEALNVTKKNMDCEHCKFHLTQKEQERKEKRIKEWYRRHGR